MQVTNINSATNTNFKAMPANKALRRAWLAKHNLAQHLVPAKEISINYTLNGFDKFRALRNGKLFTGKTQLDDMVYKFKDGILVAQGQFDKKSFKIFDYKEFLPSGYVLERYSKDGMTAKSIHLPNVGILGQQVSIQKSPFPVIV